MTNFDAIIKMARNSLSISIENRGNDPVTNDNDFETIHDMIVNAHKDHGPDLHLWPEEAAHYLVQVCVHIATTVSPVILLEVTGGFKNLGNQLASMPVDGKRH